MKTNSTLWPNTALLLTLFMSGALLLPPQLSLASQDDSDSEQSAEDSAPRVEKMDKSTHTLLIDKLSHVLSKGNVADASMVDVRLRLADLLSERARINFIESKGNNKQQSNVIADREKALAQYNIAIKELETSRRAKVIMQMAYLEDTLGRKAKAIAQYQRIIREGTAQHRPVFIGAAWKAWGEIEYRQGEFSLALEKFNKALAIKETEERGTILYRSAWCQLNLGQTEAGTQKMIQILKTPELMTFKTNRGDQFDHVFQEDVSRDFVIFIARGPVSSQHINLLTELSPPKVQHENLISLAKETQRLGKKQQSIYVWTMILELNDSFDNKHMVAESIDAHIHIATLHWSMNAKNKSVESLAQATKIWKKRGCSEEDYCSEIRSQMRKLITDWNRLEDKRVGPELAQAYAVYNNHFDDEYDMYFWAAQVSRILKNYNESSLLYRRSSILAHEKLQSKQGQKDPELKKLFEAALVAQIEMAESGQNLDIREAAYNHYLNLNPKGPRALEVRYQRAHVYYDKKLNSKAADEFHAVAISSDKGLEASLHKKSADLALDALVLSQREGEVEAWALEFAKAFPSARLEYIRIARNAVLKEVAQISEDPSSSNSELRAATQRMSQLNLEGATVEERTLATRNFLILAVRTLDLEQTQKAADRLLATPKLSESDRELALEKKVWVAEMHLDFATAFRLTLQMKMSQRSDADRALRLGFLAELANLQGGKSNASTYYNQALNARGVTSEQRNLAATRLVRLSHNPWKELSQFRSILKNNREAYADLILQVAASQNNVAQGVRLIRSESLESTSAGQVLARAPMLTEIQGIDKSLAQHRLITQSGDALLQTTIKARLRLLSQVDALIKTVLKTHDSILQVVTLSIAARENERLAGEIEKLPIPGRLSKDQEREYKDALNKQAKIYHDQAETLNDKANEFWEDDDSVKNLAEQIEKSSRAVSRLLGQQYHYATQLAPRSARNKIQDAVETSNGRATLQDAIEARRSLAQDPFSRRRAEKLRDIEIELNHDPMVTYLDARIAQLEEGPKTIKASKLDNGKNNKNKSMNNKKMKLGHGGRK